jgi:hypothetical protein
MARPAVFLAAVMIVLLALPAAALAQDEPDARCHPFAGWLASQIGGEEWDCQALMDLHAEGNGYGNLAKAWYLSHFALDRADRCAPRGERVGTTGPGGSVGG